MTTVQKIFLAMILAGLNTALGQSISFTIPGPLSGTAVPLPCTVSSITNLATVEWQIDGERELIVPSIQGSICPTGIWNSYYISNGSGHTMVAIARDAANRVLATSSRATFSVENDLPEQTTPTTDVTAANGPAPILTIGSGGVNSNGAYLALKTTGTSVVTQAAPVTRSASGGSSLSTATFSSSSGQTLIAQFVWTTYTTTITVSNAGNATWYCGPVSNAQTGARVMQQCVGTNNTPTASDKITMTYSASEPSSYDVIHSFLATNIATGNPIDASGAVNPGGGTTQQCPPITAVSQGGDLLVFGFAKNNAAVATAGPGYTGSFETTNNISNLEYAQMPSSVSNWLGEWGVTLTVNGPNSSYATKTFTLFVDGRQVVQNTSVSAASSNMIFDSTPFANGSHQILARADGPNCSGCVGGAWTDMGAWEQPITFVNPVLASQLLLSAHEAFLCVTATGTCHYPQSYTFTGTLLNTDGSTSATSLTSCTLTSAGGNLGAAVSQSGSSCTFTAVSAGYATITATETGGKTRVGYIYVAPLDGIPHFSSTGGTILTNFTPGSSFIHIGQFFSGSSFTSPQTPVYSGAQTAADAIAAGINNFEAAMSALPPGIGVSQSTFQTSAQNDVNNVCGVAATYGLKVHLIGDNWFRSTSDGTSMSNLSAVMLGSGGAYALGPSSNQSALTYYLTQYLSCAIALDGVDEVTSSWGINPLQGVGFGGLQPGNGSGLTSIVGNGTTTTVTCSQCSMNGSKVFIIHGDTSAGAANLNYNPATNSNRFSGNGGNFTFSSSFNGTASASATLEPYVNYTFDASGNACPSGGSSAGPCPNYIPYNTFYTIRGWQKGTVPMTWPAVGGASGTAINQWCGAVSAGSPSLNLADYCTAYYPGTSAFYLPKGGSLSALQGMAMLGTLRTTILPNMNLATPLLSETYGTTLAYGFVGYPIPVASCSGDTITFSQDHLLRNILPTDTRLWVTGSSGGACDGNYYVFSTPDSTHIRVFLTAFNFTASASTGTVTWDTTSTSSVCANGCTFTSVSATSGQGGYLHPTNTYPKVMRGHTFTVSASGTALDSKELLFTFDTPDPANQYNNYIHQMANFSASTGGTAYIIPNNSYVRGPQSYAANSEIGLRFMFAGQVTPFLERAAGTRQYGYSPTPDFFDRTGYDASNGTYDSNGVWIGSSTFNTKFNVKDIGGVSGGNQAHINGHWDYANTFQYWTATTHGNLLMQFLEKSGFLFQPSMSGPDYGQFFETAARTSSYGNLLMIQGYNDGPQSCTANLSPYLVSGQPIYRYYGTWSGIQMATLTAGTASDTMTCEPGAFRAYVFPQPNQYTPQQPVITVRMADVHGASDVVIQYAYTRRAFDPSVLARSLLNTFDCGSSGTCVLPVDRAIGPVYYRMVYLDVNSHVVAISDLQIL